MKTLKNIIFVVILLVGVFSCKKDTTIAPTLVKSNEAPVPPVTTVKMDTTLRQVDFIFTPAAYEASKWSKLKIVINHKGDSTYNLLIKGADVWTYIEGQVLTDFLSTCASNVSKYPEAVALRLAGPTQSTLIYSAILHQGDYVSVTTTGIPQNDLIHPITFKIGSSTPQKNSMSNGINQNSAYANGTVN